MKMSADGFSFEIKNTGTVHFFPGKIRVFGKGTPGEILLDRQLQPWYVPVRRRAHNIRSKFRRGNVTNFTT